MPYPWTHNVSIRIHKASLIQNSTFLHKTTLQLCRTKEVSPFTRYPHCHQTSFLKSFFILTSYTKYYHPAFLTKRISFLWSTRRIPAIIAMKTEKQHWKLFMLYHLPQTEQLRLSLASSLSSRLSSFFLMIIVINDYWWTSPEVILIRVHIVLPLV